MASLGVGCTTAYDAYGYPRTVVDPNAALLGAAAAGLVGYGIGRSSSHHHDHDHYRYASYRHHRNHGYYY